MAERIVGMVKPQATPGLSMDGSARRIADRISAARADEGFRNYLDARDVACAMLDEDGRGGAAASGWMDASALTVAELRAALGRALGDAPEDYAVDDSAHQAAVLRLHAVLSERDDQQLWRGEPEGLGLYGYSSVQGRLNLSGAVIRYALLALYRANFLVEFLKDKKRTLAVVGAGWGGIAVAFKGRFPKARVIVLDEPEALLRAATYIRTVAPGLKLATATRSSLDATFGQLDRVDVLLLPFYLIDQIRAVRIDAAILDAVTGTRDLNVSVEALERLGLLGCERLCAVSGRAAVQRRMAQTWPSETLATDHLIDPHGGLDGVEEAGGDLEALAPLGRLGLVVVRQ